LITNVFVTGHFLIFCQPARGRTSIPDHVLKTAVAANNYCYKGAMYISNDENDELGCRCCVRGGEHLFYHQTSDAGVLDEM